MSGKYEPLRPAAPDLRPDGTLYSPEYDDIYASAQGTEAESEHVFVQGNDLVRRWASPRRFCILETGFGAGLNFLVAWKAWRESAPAGSRLDYISVEHRPFLAGDLALVLRAHPRLRAQAEELLDRYPRLVPGFHRLHLDGQRVCLTLLFGDATDMLKKVDARVHAFFLDGFAPDRNPDMWTPALFGQLGRLCAEEATLATYTVAGAVRRGLAEAGFVVERRPGFGAKRQMLAGRFRASREAPPPPRRRVAIIGAGLAGSSCAHRLASRGWQVTLLERRSGPAQEASGVRAGLVRPVISLDWNLHSRFTVASFLYGIRHLADLARSGHAVTNGRAGVLHLAKDEAHLGRMTETLRRFSLPPELVRLVDVREASELAGQPVSGAGWWFPEGVWLDPARLVAANIAAAGEAVEVRCNAEVAQLRRDGDHWSLIDDRGATLVQAPVVVLANAAAAARFAQAAALPLRRVRGQITLVPERGDVPLLHAVARDGYVTPATGGVHCLGSTFDENDDDAGERIGDHRANLSRLEAMLPGRAAGVEAGSLRGQVAFRAMALDRLPILGDLHGGEIEGLHCCLGLGSRGMTWAALAGEVVASRLEGNAMPVERDLLKALASRRFADRRETVTRG